MPFFLRQKIHLNSRKSPLEMSMCTRLALLCLTHCDCVLLEPPLGSQHHVDKALNLIGKKFKELNLTNIYAPPLPSLALPSLPMTSWVSMPLGDQDSWHPFPSPCPKQTPKTIAYRRPRAHRWLRPLTAASTGQFCF